MKTVKGSINEALAQVANYNKKQRLVVEAEALDERVTDKYGNAKLSDADKDKIAKLRQKIKDHEILANRLRDEISQIKKNAGIDN
jgi:hypothetical protein